MSANAYVFLDEGGNFDFSKNGTTYFSMTATTLKRPFNHDSELNNYKYDCIEWGSRRGYFHCSEDNKHIRNRVFGIIESNLHQISTHCVVVNKRLVKPELQEDKKFYPTVLGKLLSQTLEDNNYQNIIIITDRIPVKIKRDAIEKAIKTAVPDNIQSYKLLHHDSKSHFSLQVADYLNWAVFRKWEKKETIYYDKIKSAIKTETLINDPPD